MKDIQLTNARALEGLVVSVEVIDPATAAAWLEHNRLNRPLVRNHVHFLAGQISGGLWQLNGEPIVIANDDEVLEGQHRLHAVIEAGIAIKTLVVYGITKEAFKTMNTGRVRSGSDALWVFNSGHALGVTKSVASAVPRCMALERRQISFKERAINAEVIEYVTEHPTLWDCAESLVTYPKQQRLITLSTGTACFEMFQRKHKDLAQDFMRKLFSGEQIGRTDPEYALRSVLMKDVKRNARLPETIKLRMTIKAWNLRRRNREGSQQGVTYNPAKDPSEVVIM